MTNDQEKPEAPMTKKILRQVSPNMTWKSGPLSLRSKSSIFARKFRKILSPDPIINQLIRAGTSIGANYCEADEASSKKDFLNKVFIAKKETKETKYWLRVIAYAVSDTKSAATVLWKEAQELNLIFAAIIRNTKANL